MHTRLPKAITGEKLCLADGIGVGNDECLQESWMREIRTSGLTRGSNGIGESRPLLSTLPDSMESYSVGSRTINASMPGEKTNERPTQRQQSGRRVVGRLHPIEALTPAPSRRRRIGSVFPLASGRRVLAHPPPHTSIPSGSNQLRKP
jgi:hypothetical protein